MIRVAASAPTLVADPTSQTSNALPAGFLPTGGQADVLPARLLSATQHPGHCWWLGVHGGAGESSLAALFPMFPASEHHWPVHPSWRTNVVLVARTNYRGMTAVQDAMVDWSANYRSLVNVLGLVLVADRPGKLPRPLRDLQRDVERATDHTWRLPWIDCWTVGEVPSPSNAPTKDVEALRLGITAAVRAAGKERHDG